MGGLMFCRDAPATPRPCARQTRWANSELTALGTPTVQAIGTLVMEVSYLWYQLVLQSNLHTMCLWYAFLVAYYIMSFCSCQYQVSLRMPCLVVFPCLYVQLVELRSDKLHVFCADYSLCASKQQYGANHGCAAAAWLECYSSGDMQELAC